MADEIDPTKQGGGNPAESGPTIQEPVKPSDEEVRKAQLVKDIAELEAAKVSANAELQRVRDLKKIEKKDKPKPAPTPEAEEEVVIDENDPAAKAWLKKIQSTISPVAEELEKEKAENRASAISKFLGTKPSLAKNPEKLKELIAVYERSHTASERTVDGIIADLEKSYAYTHSAELLDAARQVRVDDAKRNAIFSDIAISRGATDYSSPKEEKKNYSDEEKAILAKWEQSSAFPKIKETTSKE